MTFNYQVGGSLPADAPSYVERQCDREYYDLLKERKYCYVFNCRQMGKSSLRVRVTHKLQAEGIVCATIDPQKIGVEVSCDQWYASAIRSLVGDLDLKSRFDLRSWIRERELLSPVQRFAEFIETVVLQEIDAPIVIFVEEIDRLLSLKFGMYDFFGLVRSFFEDRPTKPDYNRLTFSFLGVATPTDLIQSHNTSAFNIGYAVEMAGFTLTEALPLMQGLSNKVPNPRNYLEEGVKWTGGQPFLIQRLLGMMEKELAGIAPPENIAVWVKNLVQERIVTNWESQDTPPHLTTIRDRVTSVEEKLRGRMLGCYQQVLADGELADDRSEEQSKLRLTGLVVRRDGRLVSYNLIYGAVFNNLWVEGQLADLRPEFYGSAFRAWQDADQKDGFLLRGEALQNADEWSRGKHLSDVDEDFLQESREFNRLKELAEVRITAEKQKTKTAFIGVFVSLFLAGLAGSLASFAIAKANQATQNSKAAFNNSIELVETLSQNNDQLQALTKSIQTLNLLKFLGETSNQDYLKKIHIAISKVKEQNRLEGHKGTIWDICISSDGRTIVSGGADKTIRVWNIDGELLATTPIQNDEIFSVACSYSSNPLLVASTSNDGYLRIWQIDTKKHQISMIQEFYKKVKGGILKASFSSDNKTIAFASSDGFIRIWDRNKRDAQSMIREIPAVNFKKYSNIYGVYSLDFQTQSDLLVYGYENGEVYVWNWKENQKPKLLGKHSTLISHVKFSHDSSLLASADNQGNIKIWKNLKLDNFKLIGEINARNDRFSFGTYQVAFTNKGDFLASSHGDKDEGIKIWRISKINTDKILTEPDIQLVGHTKSVKGINFLPTNQSFIVSSSEDETIRIWKWQKEESNLDDLTTDNLLHQACSFGSNYFTNRQSNIDIQETYNICLNK